MTYDLVEVVKISHCSGTCGVCLALRLHPFGLSLNPSRIEPQVSELQVESQPKSQSKCDSHSQEQSKLKHPPEQNQNENAEYLEKIQSDSDRNTENIELLHIHVQIKNDIVKSSVQSQSVFSQTRVKHRNLNLNLNHMRVKNRKSSLKVLR